MIVTPVNICIHIISHNVLCCNIAPTWQVNIISHSVLYCNIISLSHIVIQFHAMLCNVIMIFWHDMANIYEFVSSNTINVCVFILIVFDESKQSNTICCNWGKNVCFICCFALIVMIAVNILAAHSNKTKTLSKNQSKSHNYFCN